MPEYFSFIPFQEATFIGKSPFFLPGENSEGDLVQHSCVTFQLIAYIFFQKSLTFLKLSSFLFLFYSVFSLFLIDLLTHFPLLFVRISPSCCFKTLFYLLNPIFYLFLFSALSARISTLSITFNVNFLRSRALCPYPTFLTYTVLIFLKKAALASLKAAM
jgi:hypothetical protein